MARPTITRSWIEECSQKLSDASREYFEARVALRAGMIDPKRRIDLFKRNYPNETTYIRYLEEIAQELSEYARYPHTQTLAA